MAFREGIKKYQQINREQPEPFSPVSNDLGKSLLKYMIITVTVMHAMLNIYLVYF